LCIYIPLDRKKDQKDAKSLLNLCYQKFNFYFFIFFQKKQNIICLFKKLNVPLWHKYRGMEQLAARWAHNPKVIGSSPVPATW
jgi:hypothetical protein